MSTGQNHYALGTLLQRTLGLEITLHYRKNHLAPYENQALFR